MPRSTTLVAGPRTMPELRALADAPGFALLHRPHSADPDAVDVLHGDVRVVVRLAELALPPLRAAGSARPPVRAGNDRIDLAVLMPYRQLAEKGFACRDDGVPMLALGVTGRTTISVTDALAGLPDQPVRLTGAELDLSDRGYAELVRRVVNEEIGRGEGSNFVLRRSFTASVAGHPPTAALAIFRRLLQRERGAYCTFVVHCGGRTLVGATPERHVSLRAGRVSMNPISGTYRYPPAGPDLAGVLRFLADGKETDELAMVLDEELKMMAGMCPLGGRIVGPQLTEMARLAHTGYLVEGHTRLDVREILRRTMYAPTVTGSPVENACRVIARHEPRGRGYYGGALALIGQDGAGRTLDASILIRTADLDAAGRLELGAGATIVRHSDSRAEAAETRAKLAGVLAAIGEPGQAWVAPPRRLATDRRVRRALAARNRTLSPFWLAAPGRRATPVPALAGRRVLVIDAEDAFTEMLAQQVRSLGPRATVRPYRAAPALDGYDAVILGPGPGDPGDERDPRIAVLARFTTELLGRRQPFLSVCLSHQVLCGVLGMPVRRRETPAQGQRLEIDLFGRPERVGCYHTFAAYADADRICGAGGEVQVSRDPGTGEVYALRSAAGSATRFWSMQFHLESVLTERGPALLTEALLALLGSPAGQPGASGWRAPLAVARTKVNHLVNASEPFCDASPPARPATGSA